MTQNLPQFFCNVRSERRKQNYIGRQCFFVDTTGLLSHVNHLVVIFHEFGNNGIQVEAFQTFCDIVNQAMTQFYHLFSFCNICFCAVLYQFPETIQETVYTVDSSVIPLCIQFRRSYEQLIDTQRVTSVISYQIVRRNNVSFRFTHLDTVLTGDHTLVEQFMEWFIKVNSSDIIQELGIETGIQQMQYRMFHTTDVHIYRQIFVSFFFGNQFFIIFVIYITQEVPGRTCPLRHSVGLAFCRSATGRALAVNPFVDSSQW